MATCTRRGHHLHKYMIFLSSFSWNMRWPLSGTMGAAGHMDSTGITSMWDTAVYSTQLQVRHSCTTSMWYTAAYYVPAGGGVGASLPWVLSKGPVWIRRGDRRAQAQTLPMPWVGRVAAWAPALSPSSPSRNRGSAAAVAAVQAPAGERERTKNNNNKCSYVREARQRVES